MELTPDFSAMATTWLRQAEHVQPVVVYAVAWLMASLEYVFPPVPGDTLVLSASLLAGRGVVHPVLLWALCVVGGSTGLMAAYGVGRVATHRPRIRDRLVRWLGPERVQSAIERMQTRGRWLLLGNRLLPGFRIALVLAAGMAEMRWWRVLLYGGASVALWNAVLVTAGSVLGHNLEQLQALLATYSTVVWSVLGTAAVLWLARKAWQKRAG